MNASLPFRPGPDAHQVFEMCRGGGSGRADPVVELGARQAAPSTLRWTGGRFSVIHSLI